MGYLEEVWDLLWRFHKDSGLKANSWDGAVYRAINKPRRIEGEEMAVLITTSDILEDYPDESSPISKNTSDIPLRGTEIIHVMDGSDRSFANARTDDITSLLKEYLTLFKSEVGSEEERKADRQDFIRLWRKLIEEIKLQKLNFRESLKVKNHNILSEGE